jgi:hypothetical protein
MSDIKIYRTYPVINGFVQLPLNRSLVKNGQSGVQLYKTVDDILAAIADTKEVSLSLGSGRNTGSKHGAQSYVELPGVAADSWYTSDPADTEV